MLRVKWRTNLTIFLLWSPSMLIKPLPHRGLNVHQMSHSAHPAQLRSFFIVFRCLWWGSGFCRAQVQISDDFWSVLFISCAHIYYLVSLQLSYRGPGTQSEAWTDSSGLKTMFISSCCVREHRLLLWCQMFDEDLDQRVWDKLDKVFVIHAVLSRGLLYLLCFCSMIFVPSL